MIDDSEVEEAKLVDVECVGDGDIRVVLPIGQIPLNSVVSKVKGTKKYKLVDSIKLFTPRPGKPKKQQAVTAEEGTRFMAGQGTAEAFPGDFEVIWHTSERTLLRYLVRRTGTWKIKGQSENDTTPED